MTRRHGHEPPLRPQIARTAVGAVEGTSFDVRFWDVRRLNDTATGRYRVRWAVAGRECCRSFRTKALADGHLTDLKAAARAGLPFDTGTGLPVTDTAAPEVSWYAFARDYTDMKWPQLAANSRRGVAEALTDLTLALLQPGRTPSDRSAARTALMKWAFNTSTRRHEPPDNLARALDWVAAASLPVTALADPAVTRATLTALTRTQAGNPAAASSVRRKRAILYNACGHAVELGHLPGNPIDRVQWRAPALAEAVDRRVVANPTQVRALLAAVRNQGERGQHLEAFFGCLYYAGMRPAEAVALRGNDCHLPEQGWGHLDLTCSEPKAGIAWTDTHTARDTRSLKHRARHATRTVPIPPELVILLRDHLHRYGPGPDGRLFRTLRGKPLHDSTYGKAWKTARATALTPQRAASPLAARPYDLRHAAVSIWLNAGVPATEVARRAGHSVNVLLTVYANCLDGRTHTDNNNIGDALAG